MGLEATCAVRFGKQASDGKALLETTELVFRGALRLKIPLKDVSSVEAKKGSLVDVKVVSFSDTLSGLKMVIPVAQRKKR